MTPEQQQLLVSIRHLLEAHTFLLSGILVFTLWTWFRSMRRP